jgi:endonuclease-3
LLREHGVDRWASTALPEKAAAFDEGVMQLSFLFDDDPMLSRMRKRLLAMLGPRRDMNRIDPASVFVYAMASCNTRDEDAGSAIVNVCRLVPCWDDLAYIDTHALANALEGVTNAYEKAENLQAAVRDIRARYGRFDLSFLANLSFDDAYVRLTRMRGVGAKVASATLNFSNLQKPALVVDRHVLRIAQRIGLVPPKSDFVRGFNALQRWVPNDWDADDCSEMHWLMKELGQTICRAQRPACDRCPLRDLCVYGKRAKLH